MVFLLPRVPSIALFVAVGWCVPTALAFSLSMATTSNPGTASQLKSILKKPSKVLTVGVEVDLAETTTTTTTTTTSDDDLSILSMQLRKSGVSAIWTSSLDAVGAFAAEQETARGDFPGPLPVVYAGEEQHVGAAVANGASAVVLRPGSSSDGPSVEDACEVVWRIDSPEALAAATEATGGSADAAFWVEDPSLLASVPKGCLAVVAVDPMQPDGKEIEEGRGHKPAGCASILVRKACVGDAEDLAYAQFLVDGFTSKKSSEFSFSGLTGSTNGHFGGIQESGTVKWRRQEQQ